MPTAPTSARPSASSSSRSSPCSVADTLQHLNGLKILLVGCANLLAAVAYAFLAPVEWRYALTLMVTSLIGGRVGAHYARRIPSDPLRITIAVVGLGVAVVLALRAFG